MNEPACIQGTAHLAEIEPAEEMGGPSRACEALILTADGSVISATTAKLPSTRVGARGPLYLGHQGLSGMSGCTLRVWARLRCGIGYYAS